MHRRILAVGVSALVAVSLLGCATRSAPPTAGPPPAARERGATALDVDPADVYVRIVDVVPGLCAVIRIPDQNAQPQATLSMYTF